MQQADEVAPVLLGKRLVEPVRLVELGDLQLRRLKAEDAARWSSGQGVQEKESDYSDEDDDDDRLCGSL